MEYIPVRLVLCSIRSSVTSIFKEKNITRRLRYCLRIMIRNVWCVVGQKSRERLERIEDENDGFDRSKKKKNQSQSH